MITETARAELKNLVLFPHTRRITSQKYISLIRQAIDDQKKPPVLSDFRIYKSRDDIWQICETEMNGYVYDLFYFRDTLEKYLGITILDMSVIDIPEYNDFDISIDFI